MIIREADDTDNPTAVVVDTNAFYEGRLTRSGIKSLASLTNLGLHVIVPDVVLWELVSHAWQDLQPAREILALSGIDISQLGTSNAVYNTFLNQVTATGATVAESKPHHVQQGLNAQILRAAPASPKGEVTTGAVDYIVYMHALDATNKYSTVAVITNDKVLRKSLNKPGIKLFEAFSTVKKGDVSHMRLPWGEALSHVRYLLTDEFKDALADQMGSEGRAHIKVVGVNDLLRLNDKELGAYVDVSIPTFTGVDSDYYGRDVDRYLVTLDEASSAVTDKSLIASEPFATWPPGLTHIDEYLSTELGMIPAVIRPVPVAEFINDFKTPFTFTEENGHITFYMNDKDVAVVEHSTYTVTQEYQHDGEVYVDKTYATDILLRGSGSEFADMEKGALARLIINSALEHLE